MKKALFLSVWVVCGLAFNGCGCEDKTEEEKGKDFAGKKLDFAKGASDALNEKGSSVGRSTGSGVTNLLKGIGSGIADVVYPPIKVSPSEELRGAGIEINKAEEGSSSSNGTEANLTLSFSKIFKGRLRLDAFDKTGREMGRATSEPINQPAQSVLNLTIRFPKGMSMRDVDHCEAHVIGQKTVTLMGDLAVDTEADQSEKESAFVELGQMTEGSGEPLVVTQYVIFNSEFKGSLQLRAFDATNAEIGRSQKIEDLEQTADSSNTFEFTFHPTIKESSVSRYSLFASFAKGKLGKSRKKK